MTDQPIAMNAILNKISTTTDGGWRISFDVPESDTDQIKECSHMRNQSLKVVIMPVELSDE